MGDITTKLPILSWSTEGVLGDLLGWTFLMRWPCKVTSWVVLCGIAKGAMLATLSVSWMTALVKGRFFLSSTCSWRLPVTLLISSWTWSGRWIAFVFLTSFNAHICTVCFSAIFVDILSSLPCILGYFAINRSSHLSVIPDVSVPAANRFITVFNRFSLSNWLSVTPDSCM